MSTATAQAAPQSFAFPIFPTICYRRGRADLAALNPELARIVLEQEKTLPSLKKGASIKGGYHSDVKFFDQPHPAVAQLKKGIMEEFSNYLSSFWRSESASPVEKHQPLQTVMWGWSVILREGDFSSPHLHVRSTISGVYYVQTPNADAMVKDEENKAGWLSLCDPRVRAYVDTIPGQFRTIRVPPVPGTLVMFPSHLEHYVSPFKGPGERISIAFNFRIVNQTLEA